MVSGLVGLRGLVHENFIPALERCGVILSRLLGIARFHDSEESIGFNEVQISRLMDILSGLMLVAHKVLTIVMDELEHFTVFSTWLRLEIDKQASSSVSEELTEKEATMDNAKVLSYLQHYLTSSPLAVYFGEAGKDEAAPENIFDHTTSVLDLLDKQLQEQEAGRSYTKALPQIDFLTSYLTSKAQVLFKGIAEAEKQNVKFGQATKLSIGQRLWKHDIQVTQPNKKVKAQVPLFRTRCASLTVYHRMIPPWCLPRWSRKRTNRRVRLQRS